MSRLYRTARLNLSERLFRVVISVVMVRKPAHVRRSCEGMQEDITI
jgi:hypothetical protein